MVLRTIKRAATFLLGATGVLMALVALFLLSVTAQNSDEFGRLNDAILVINIVGVVLLFLLVIGNLFRLFQEYSDNVPGS